MNPIFTQVRDAAHRHIWESNLAALPAPQAAVVKTVRVAYAVARDIADGQLTLRAMSLVYTTLLSLVPLLAVSFSVLKAFGVHNQIEPLLFNFLQPLGEKGLEVGTRIIEFVENIKVGVLGSLGLALLIYTVIALLQKIERAFNFIWHLDHNRRFAQRFSDYLSVILIGPVLVFSALGITASIKSSVVVQKLTEITFIGPTAHLLGQFVPYLLIVAAFTFVYIFIPNTKVRLGAALAGGVVSGVLWETAGWLFASFVVSSTKYAAIYSSFAILVMFMIWLYLGWIILLVGASVSFYQQNPFFLVKERKHAPLSNTMRERLALLILGHVADSHLNGKPPWSIDRLAVSMGLPYPVVEESIKALVDGALLVPSADEPPAYLPARDLHNVDLKEVLDVVRNSGSAYPIADHAISATQVTELMATLEGAIGSATEGETARGLAGEDVLKTNPPDADAHAAESTRQPVSSRYAP